MVAFYSYMSRTDMHPKANQTIIFDHLITNSCVKYIYKTGVFYPNQDGLYVFSWTVYCSNGGYLINELVVNRRSVGVMLCSGKEQTTSVIPQVSLRWCWGAVTQIMSTPTPWLFWTELSGVSQLISLLSLNFKYPHAKIMIMKKRFRYK